LFIEKGIDLINNSGLLGYIIPNYWLSTKYDRKLRKKIFQENKLVELANVYQVFERVIVDTLLISISKRNFERGHISIDSNLKTIDERLLAVKNNNWTYLKEVDIDTNQDDIVLSFKELLKLKADKEITDYFELKFGVKLYEVGKGIPPQKKDFSSRKLYEAKNKVNSSYVELLKGRHIKRYLIDFKDSYVQYGDNLAAPRDPNIFIGERILVHRIVSKKTLDATFCNESFICNTDIITLKPKTNINCKFYLSILCSKLIGYYIKASNINLDRNVFPKINTVLV